MDTLCTLPGPIVRGTPPIAPLTHRSIADSLDPFKTSAAASAFDVPNVAIVILGEDPGEAALISDAANMHDTVRKGRSILVVPDGKAFSSHITSITRTIRAVNGIHVGSGIHGENHAVPSRSGLFPDDGGAAELVKAAARAISQMPDPGCGIRQQKCQPNVFGDTGRAANTYFL